MFPTWRWCHTKELSSKFLVVKLEAALVLSSSSNRNILTCLVLLLIFSFLLLMVSCFLLLILKVCDDRRFELIPYLDSNHFDDWLSTYELESVDDYAFNWRLVLQTWVWFWKSWFCSGVPFYEPGIYGIYIWFQTHWYLRATNNEIGITTPRSCSINQTQVNCHKLIMMATCL